MPIKLSMPNACVFPFLFFPGFIDLLLIYRSWTYLQEDIVTGTKAAAHPRFYTVCAMPNTDPVTDNIASVEYIQLRAKDYGSARVYVIGAITKQSAGEEIAEMATMKSGGIVAVSDDGKCVQDARLMLSCMKYASNFGLTIIIHPEELFFGWKGQIHSGKLLPKLGLSVFRRFTRTGLLKKLLLPGDIMLAEKCWGTTSILLIFPLPDLWN
jgi:dihydroorotase